MKKFLTIIWICVTVIVFQLTESGAGPKAWKIGHVRPEGSAIDKDINTFSEAVRQGTEGAIVFGIYPANKLGDYSVVQERVSFHGQILRRLPIMKPVRMATVTSW